VGGLAYLLSVSGALGPADVTSFTVGILIVAAFGISAGVHLLEWRRRRHRPPRALHFEPEQ
jgi:hypothetical protein